MTADAVGGVWTYALDLARGLRAHGVDTVLLVNGPPPADPPPDVEVVATGLPLDWLATAPEEVADAGRRLAALADRLQADMVQLNGVAYAADARFAPPMVGVHHSCTRTWWRAVRGHGPVPPDVRWRFGQTRRGLSACDAAVVPTHAFAAAVHAAYVLPSPLHVVWNGRPVSDPPPTGDGERALFAAGRLWDEGKGMAVLDAAAAHVDAPIRAAGPLAAPGGAPVAFGRLEALGVLSPTEMRAQLHRASVFVAPSFYEPFGLTVLEAAQAGRPLVLSDIPVFRELWSGAATFFPPGDAGALARTLNDLMGSAELRRDAGRAAAQRARAYTVEAMAAGMMDVFRQVQLRRS